MSGHNKLQKGAKVRALRDRSIAADFALLDDTNETAGALGPMLSKK